MLQEATSVIDREGNSKGIRREFNGNSIPNKGIQALGTSRRMCYLLHGSVCRAVRSSFIIILKRGNVVGRGSGFVASGCCLLEF